MVMKVLIALIFIFSTQSFANTANNKGCLAMLHKAQEKLYKEKKSYSNSIAELKNQNEVISHICKDAKLTLAGFKDRFTIIGKFENELWVINEKRDLIEGSL